MLRPVLIAALSARALAQSARRAGYEPIVLDAFGDEDTRAAAARYERRPRAAAEGFHKHWVKSFAAHWSRLKPPPALVLGAGFEDRPEIVEAAGRKMPLAGCGRRAIEGVKRPETFFPALDRLRIAHPETRRAPPADPTGWLKKQTGACGGAHVAACGPRDSRDPGIGNSVYFQRRIAGAPVSVLGVARGDGLDVVGFSRQWANPMPRRPFRYGGAVGPIDVPEPLAARMRGAAEAVSREFGLLGLVSFDFIAGGDAPSLLEVNPRPGATLDIFDDGTGWLFAAHMKACLGEACLGPAAPGSGRAATHVLEAPPPNLPLAERDGAGGVPSSGIWPRRSSTKNNHRAAAYLYADRGSLTFPKIDWPDWTADRPAPGARIPRRHPVATVFAEGATADETEALCRKRLGQIEEMIYGRA